MSNQKKIFDAIVIGGGPAGINCALELSYCNVECLLIARDNRLGGQLWDLSGELVNFAGGYFKTGGDLAVSMQELLKKTDIQLALNTTVDRFDSESKTIIAGNEVYHARSVLLATGYRLRRLDLPGVNQYQKDVLYRDDKAVSDYAKMRTAVMGGGDNALMKALDLAEVAEHVYLLNRSSGWRARSEFLTLAKAHSRIEIIEHTELQSLSGTSKLSGAHLVDKRSNRVRTISIDKLFVKIGYQPNTEPFKGQVAMDEGGHLLVDNNRCTSVAGIFAAGDIVAKTCPRVATACGDGSMAGEAMQIYLGKRLVP